jgi:hypothetical protein
MQDISMSAQKKPFVKKVTINHYALEKVMNDADKKRCGLTNLSSAQWFALDEWLDKNAVVAPGPKPN